MKHIFIINPTSGKGRYKEVINWLETHGTNIEDGYEIHLTKYPGHALEIAKEMGPDRILYAVGGDGTAHEVLNGMHKDAELAIIPAGTGNDFYRLIRNRKNLEEILEDTIFNSEIIKLDSGSINDELFLNCANLGVDAQINVRANNFRSKWFPRSLVYIAFAILELMKLKMTSVEIEVDGEKEHKELTLMSIMNGKYYGNGFKSAPLADISDGLLDAVIIDKIKKPRAYYLIIKYMQGTHLNEPEVTYKKIKAIKIKSEDPIYYGTDGEIYKNSEINIKVHPQRIQLRVPVPNKMHLS